MLSSALRILGGILIAISTFLLIATLFVTFWQESDNGRFFLSGLIVLMAFITGITISALTGLVGILLIAGANYRDGKRLSPILKKMLFVVAVMLIFVFWVILSIALG